MVKKIAPPRSSSARKPKRRLALFNILSVKGGVGKSCLALVCGSYLAKKGVDTWIVDTDFEGTDLADALEGKLEGTEHHLHEFLSIAPRPTSRNECNEKARQVARKFRGVDHLWLVSSSAKEAARQVMEPLLSTESWTGYVYQRLLALSATYAEESAAECIAIVLDHGPGLHALSQQFLESFDLELESLSGREVSRRYVIVSSADTVDLRATRLLLEQQLDAALKRGKSDDEKEHLEDEETARIHVIFNRLRTDNAAAKTKYDTVFRQELGLRIWLRLNPASPASPQHDLAIEGDALALFDGLGASSSINELFALVGASKSPPLDEVRFNNLGAFLDRACGL